MIVKLYRTFVSLHHISKRVLFYFLIPLFVLLMNKLAIFGPGSNPTEHVYSTQRNYNTWPLILLIFSIEIPLSISRHTISCFNADTQHDASHRATHEWLMCHLREIVNLHLNGSVGDSCIISSC